MSSVVLAAFVGLKLGLIWVRKFPCSRAKLSLIKGNAFPANLCREFIQKPLQRFGFPHAKGRLEM
jgi:hypothetical protein